MSNNGPTNPPQTSDNVSCEPAAGQTPSNSQNVVKGGPAAPAITSQQAGLLLRADLANLAKKVKDGKTLSVSERNILQSAFSGEKPSGAEFAENAVELADLLGIDRRTISRWRKIEGNPGVRPDGRYHVQSWREFKNNHQGGEDGGELSQTQLRARQILLQNQKLEIQIAVLKREYMPVADVEKMGGELGSAIRKVVSQIHLCAPTVVGVSVAEAEARLKEVEDEILEQLHLLRCEPHLPSGLGDDEPAV